MENIYSVDFEIKFTTSPSFLLIVITVLTSLLSFEACLNYSCQIRLQVSYLKADAKALHGMREQRPVIDGQTNSAYSKFLDCRRTENGSLLFLQGFKGCQGIGPHEILNDKCHGRCVKRLDIFGSFTIKSKLGFL